MKIKLDDLELYFPFKHIYPEQFDYITKLKSIFAKASTNSFIQVPPALTQAICFFSFYVSTYLQNSATIPRVVYSAKSTMEIEHAMKGLKLVLDYIEKKHNIKVDILGLCISEKKNLCVNESVCNKPTKEAINYECNKRIAPWSRALKDVPMEMEFKPDLCQYYEGYIDKMYNLPKISGCFTLQDLREIGKGNKICPYYYTEEIFQSAQIIICDYFMLFGMKKSNNYDRKILQGAFLVFDECNGLDEQIAEIFTERISRISLDHSMKCVEDLSNQLKQTKEQDPKRYEDEYQKLVKGLTKDDLDINQINKKNEILKNTANEPKDDVMGNTGTEERKIKFPGYIRKPEHFITHLKKFILFLKGSITKNSSKVISHGDFVERYLKETLIDPNALPLAFFPARLRALSNFLHYADIETDHFLPLHSLVQFAQFFGTFAQGYEILISSIQETKVDVNEATLLILSLACLDPAGPFSQITSNIGSMIFHTETLSEIGLFARIMELADHPNQGEVQSLTIPLTTKLKVLPLIVSKGADQIELSTEHARRHDAGIMRNYSNMIVKLSEAVPDGILCMFPNMRSLKDIGLDFYDEILEKKLIFAEVPDIYETSKSVSGYKISCENGRGGVFMGLMRGKVLGNIAFDNNCARCVIIFGIPIEYTRPREFLARTRYFKAKKQIQESEFVVYSAMKEVFKGLGKIIKKRDDACVVILADRRFLQTDKIAKFPEWLQKSLDPVNTGLPSDQASYRAARFHKATEYEKEWKKFSENDIEKLKTYFDKKLNLY